MKLKVTLALGIRNLWVHRKHHVFLLTALAFCFAVITLMSSISGGMSRNVYQHSRFHYGGDFFMVGFWGYGDNPAQVVETETLESLARDADLIDYARPRTTLFLQNYLYFNGQEQLIKNTIGMDYKLESEILHHYSYSYGGPQELIQEGGIILSASLAQKMNIQGGDRITLKLRTNQGQINTGSFRVGALIDDDTLLGYYRIIMDRTALNRLLRYEDHHFSSMGFFLPNLSERDELVTSLHQRLGEVLPTGGVIQDRGDYYAERSIPWEGIRHFCYSLEVYIDEVDELLVALNLVSYLLYLLMLSITVVSVLVTYRIILHDRSRELALFQAMGVTPPQLMLMMIVEAFLLVFLSFLLGWIIYLIAMFFISRVDFHWLPGFGIFLEAGKLKGNLSLIRMFFNMSIILIAVMPPLFWQVYRQTRKNLAATLSGGTN